MRATSSRSGRRGTVRRLGYALGLLAILSQTFVLLFHRPADAMTAGAMMVGAAPLIAVSHHHHGEADSGSHAPSPKPVHCPICLALHVLGGFVPPSGAALPAAPAPVEETVGHASESAVFGGLDLGGAQPRAPPLS